VHFVIILAVFHFTVHDYAVYTYSSKFTISSVNQGLLPCLTVITDNSVFWWI